MTIVLMAESTLQFQAALTDFSGHLAVLKQAASKWVLRFSVLSDPAHFQLLITVSDTVAHLWELGLSAAQLQAHQTALGLEQVDWGMYFKLLKAALGEKRVNVREAGADLTLDVEYPLAQAKLKGSFTLRRTTADSKAVMGFLVGALETALQPNEQLKRERQPSPELVKDAPARPAAMHKPPKKKKKVTELGSKIA